MAQDNPHYQPGKEDPLVRSSRREAIFVGIIFCGALAYTLIYCAKFGYGRTEADLTFVLGFPDWVFWGIVTPWLVCTAITLAFSYVFMRDHALENPQPTDDAHQEFWDE